MTALAVASTALRRYLRDRVALFFVVVLPVLVIVIIGATVSGMGRFRVAVVDDDNAPLSTAMSSALERSPELTVSSLDSVNEARTAVARGEIALAVVVPAGYDAALRSGGPAKLVVVGDRTNTNEQAAESAVNAIIGSQAARIQAAQFATDQTGGSLDSNLVVTDTASSTAARVEVNEQVVDATHHYLPEGFSYSAPTMLILFVFINALAAGSGIIQSRQLGMYQRMLAAPLRRRTIIIGETLCYLSLALLQSILIVTIGAVLFGVNWGNPPAAIALIAAWALVGTGAGVLSGTLFRTPEQAASIGPALGIALGMLGGCMWPLEIVPTPMKVFGHFFPHAWAVDGWTAVLSRGGTIVDIARPLLVLLGFAVALLVAATTRLRHSVTA